MYEHPYLIHRAVQLDSERASVDLERARIAREHPERVVPRVRWMDRLLPRRSAIDAGVRSSPAVAREACESA